VYVILFSISHPFLIHKVKDDVAEEEKAFATKLHVSQYRINAERANVILRTNNRIAFWTAAAEQNRIALLAATAQEERIALLTAAAHQDRIPLLAERENWHCCFNTICFCVLLLLLNLLFLQWLYYQTVYVHKL
jgi:hypothetical protein